MNRFSLCSRGRGDPVWRGGILVRRPWSPLSSVSLHQGMRSSRTLGRSRSSAFYRVPVLSSFVARRLKFVCRLRIPTLGYNSFLVCRQALQMRMPRGFLSPLPNMSSSSPDISIIPGRHRRQMPDFPNPLRGRELIQSQVPGTVRICMIEKLQARTREMRFCPQNAGNENSKNRVQQSGNRAEHSKHLHLTNLRRFTPFFIANSFELSRPFPCRSM